MGICNKGDAGSKLQNMILTYPRSISLTKKWVLFKLIVMNIFVNPDIDDLHDSHLYALW